METTDIGLGTGLRRLLELLDGDLDAHYARSIPGYRSRYTPIMKALAGGGSLTIKTIAAASGVSHSAASQTVSRMAAENLVEWEVGADARQRMIRLSGKGRDLLPTLRVQWRRTASAALELEREIALPLAQAVARAIAALEAKPFGDRVR
jgi:DNA-binding MarR family transcriptional regulator